jgi:hypothetical protein
MDFRQVGPSEMPTGYDSLRQSVEHVQKPFAFFELQKNLDDLENIHKDSHDQLVQFQQFISNVKHTIDWKQVTQKGLKSLNGSRDTKMSAKTENFNKKKWLVRSNF